MAHSDDNVSQGGLLVEDRSARRPGPNRPAPHTERWWLVDAPALPSRGRRGPAHHPSRAQTHSDGLPLGHLFEPARQAAGYTWPDRALMELDTQAMSLPFADDAPAARAFPAQTAHATPPGGWQVPATTGHVTGHVKGQAPAARAGAPLPRRRDIRNGRVQPPPPVLSGRTPQQGIALGPAAEPDTTFLGRAPLPPLGDVAPGAALAAEPFTLDLTTNPLPRRRDLRKAGQGGQADRARRAERVARKGVLSDATKAKATTAVARGAVLTGLVAVGVVTITGQHLSLGSLTPTTSDATSELSLKPAPAPTVDEALLGADVAWQRDGDTRKSDIAGQVAASLRAKQLETKAKEIAAKKAAAKRAAEKAAAAARAAAKAEALRNAQRNPKAIGRIMAAERGWTGSQWTCLDKLWTRESGWKYYADNPSSSAYGIPQALPGNRMAANGSDWATNPVTQIAWGLDYIAGRYGSPCNAWAHSERTGWY